MPELERRLIFLGGWPANSCDLNPTEMIWSIIKKRLVPGAHQDLPLAQRVSRLWNEVPKSRVAEIVRSFRKRCQICRIVTGKQRFRFITEIENMDRRLAMPVLPSIDHFPFPFSLGESHFDFHVHLTSRFVGDDTMET